MDNLKKQTSTYSQNQSALVFWHRCLSTDTMIDFANLTWSVSDISAYNVTNPPAWVIVNSNLGSLKSYLKITTSANRNILPDYFDLYNSKMVFKNSFTPFEGEVFRIEVLNANRPLNSLEAQPIYRTGIILANTNQFDFIDEISVPTEEARCPIQVLVDDSPVYMTGDWIFVPQVGDSSKSRKIQMVNTVDYDRQILVTGYCVYQPNGSVTQQVETLAGQLDKVISDLVLFTNKDKSEYLGAANNVDLAAFGNTVNSILNAEIDVGVTEFANYKGTTVTQGPGAYLKYTGPDARSDSNPTLFTVDNSVATKFLLIEDCEVFLDSQNYFGITPTTVDMAIYHHDSLNNLVEYSSILSTSIRQLTVLYSAKAKAGDYFRVYVNAGTAQVDGYNHFSIIAKKTKKKTIRQLAGL